jgi:hypothetical protein
MFYLKDVKIKMYNAFLFVHGLFNDAISDYRLK